MGAAVIAAAFGGALVPTMVTTGADAAAGHHGHCHYVTPPTHHRHHHPSASPTTTTPPRPTTVPTVTVSAPAPSIRRTLALPLMTSSLGANTYRVSDFAVANAGAALTGATVGQGVGKTILEMKPGSSTKGALVPGNGNNQGGLANPTNPFYLFRLSGVGASLSNLSIRGTDQGHLYNGVMLNSVADGSVRNVKISAIPGNSSANPGETFSLNLLHNSGTTTIRNVEIDGAGVAAAALATNSATGTTNIDGLRTHDLAYSAGIATWQQRGVLNVRHWISSNSPRALGAERLAGTINLYDPSWSAPKSGHDITLTPWAGYPAGRINLYLTAKPSRKFVILTNTPAVHSWIHVYLNGAEQDQREYVTWQG